MASGPHGALAIAEILERILLNLSLGDILYNAQRVSKFWRNCIGINNTIHEGGSLRLRQKCFVEAQLMSEEEEKADKLFRTFMNPRPDDVIPYQLSRESRYSIFFERASEDTSFKLMG